MKRVFGKKTRKRNLQNPIIKKTHINQTESFFDNDTPSIKQIKLRLDNLMSMSEQKECVGRMRGIACGRYGVVLLCNLCEIIGAGGSDSPFRSIILFTYICFKLKDCYCLQIEKLSVSVQPTNTLAHKNANLPSKCVAFFSGKVDEIRNQLYMKKTFLKVYQQYYKLLKRQK